MTLTAFKNPVFCALDTTYVTKAVTLAQSLIGKVGGLKLGMEFFYANGPAGYKAVAETGVPIFLDLKLHDIPNTVAGGIRAIVPLKPTILTIHTVGGIAMMKAAKEASLEGSGPSPLVVGVTVLTSLDESDLGAAGVSGTTVDQVRRLAGNAQEAGLDGVVCSPLEVDVLRADCGRDFKLIVPGIRPKGAAIGDQKRVMGPGEALARGADVLVIGRPITQANNPADAAEAIHAEIAASVPGS
ncbi:MAG: orotidine-5'-phosphate decarboxylase [Rhodobiaceae bacterium]|nr:MAG: orotidine-5'-phosphate decarboxylase [Rhodobiaceae bacterium]